MRSGLRFLYPGILISGVLINARGNIDRFVQASRSARNQGHYKRMSLTACGSIHHVYERFSDDSRGRQEIFMCLAALLCEQFLPIREWRCQDIDQVLLHGDHFFLSAFSSSEVFGKNASIRSKLPTAAC